MRINTLSALAATTFIASTSLAFAHASVSPGEAANGSTVRLAVSVPHGCDGAPTDTVVLKLPEGFVSAKPQAKAGWSIEVTKGDYQQSYEVHGKPVTSGALEVRWSGGALPDDQFDDFVVQGTLQGFDTGASLPFVVTQLCGTASVAWDQLAAEGQNPHDLEHPAPLLTVTTAAADGHAHGGHAMPAATGPVVLGNLELSGAFSRATLPNAPVGGGFLTIVNKGAEADRLAAVSTPAAGVGQLHQMKMEGDVMKMNELPDGIDIPANSTVALEPGGLHIMLMDLKGPLVEGTSFPVTLTFEKAGTVEIQMQVGGVGAKGEPDHSTMKH